MAIPPPRRLAHNDYTVGWICARPVEMAAAKVLLDDVHETLQVQPSDHNAYILGNMGKHNIVIACLPHSAKGSVPASTVAMQLLSSFNSIRFSLSVGIGGGIPSRHTDIRLGDIVVSIPKGSYGGVVQYDYGKSLSGGEFQHTGTLNRPPQILLTALSKLQANHIAAGSKDACYIPDIGTKSPKQTSILARPTLEDRLYTAAYEHVDINSKNCRDCDTKKLVWRSSRNHNRPVVHYGLVASANQMVEDSQLRDSLRRKFNADCIDMEAAGLMNNFPCLVIRGICDYADSHTNDDWHGYASAVATAYAKELLSCITVPSMNQTRPMWDTISDAEATKAERQNRLVKLLRFQRMNYRHEGVRKNQDATYQWLMTHPQWLAWIDQARAVEHHGLLWIKGKPGAGKSTIMNFAYSQATKNKTITAISFFFNAQGDILERSVIGMCRSLLFQLINALPTLDLLKVQRYKDELDDLYSVQHPEWGLGLLQDMLQTAVDRLGEQRLMLLIDALDECNEEEVEAMVEYFKNLGKHAMQDGKLLRICFSSRHYPHIDIQNGLVLDLESQQGHCNDITTYIESRLKIGERKTSQGIKRWLYERSKGIFMWVVLVVTILNRALDRGQIHEITYRLDEIPTGLSSLFKNILGRGQNDIREFRLCIQWIYFAQRPLEIQEYYFAVVSGLRPDRLSKWDRKEITEEDMKKFVLSSSRGFAEIINHPYQGSTVHFIHESVREFFLKDGFSVLWPNTSKLDFERAGHHEIQECCDNYLKFATANWKFSIAWVDDDDTDRVHNLKRSVPPKFPFLEYATQNILYHTNATSERRSQKALLEDFLLKSWINYHNIFATHLNHLYKSSASLLYILADNNYVELISVALEMDPRFDIRGERHVYPLFAALINGHRDAFNALLQEGTEGPKEDIFGKLTNKSRNLLYQLNGGTPLLWATMEGHEQIVRLLVARGVDVNAKDSDGRTPLSWAAFNGCGQAVELLLAKGGDANAEDCTGRTPLSWAASKGHKQVVRLLSQMTMYTDARSVFQTSLLLAASEGHEDIVETLLRNIIDADVVSVGRTPLSMAAMEGHENIVRMLLDRGLDVQVKDICGQVPLSSASSQGHAGVVRLLLDRGADARAQDADGRTALDWARSEGHIKVEEILSLRGVDE